MPKKKPLKSSAQPPSDEASDSDTDELETISDTDELEALENADSQVDADSNRGYDPYNNVKK